MKDLWTLIDACCEARDNPAFEPKVDDPNTPENERATYCNMAVRHIANKMGYLGFMRNQLANEMIDQMAGSQQWQKVDMGIAQKLANTGCLVVACQRMLPHGHVAVVRPGNEGRSAKWGQVPKVVNIGVKNSIGVGVNWVFPGSDKPDFYVWNE